MFRLLQKVAKCDFLVSRLYISFNHIFKTFKIIKFLTCHVYNDWYIFKKSQKGYIF